MAFKMRKRRILRNPMQVIQRMINEFSSTIEPSWRNALASQFTQLYFIELADFLIEERKQHVFYPPLNLIFAWTHLCPLHAVKVVILGQDPYFNEGQANGNAFSFQDTDIPPSLDNIFKELERDPFVPFTRPPHGDLTGWVMQGVLLLNSILTVRGGKPKSHWKRGWEDFTEAVIACIIRCCPNAFFIHLGRIAKDRLKNVERNENLSFATDQVLLTSHPAPQGVHRGFRGCGCFSAANVWVQTTGQQPINWNWLPCCYDNRWMQNWLDFHGLLPDIRHEIEMKEWLEGEMMNQLAQKVQMWTKYSCQLPPPNMTQQWSIPPAYVVALPIGIPPATTIFAPPQGF